MIKIKGNILLQSVVFSCIVGILAILFIKRNEFSKMDYVRYIDTVKSIRQLENSLLLASIDMNDASLSLAQNDVDIKKRSWGLFHLISAKSKKNNLAKNTFVGGLLRDINSCLIIKRKDIPLQVLGSTSIKGTVNISNRPIKKPFVEGENFHGLLELSNHPSDEHLELNLDLISSIKEYLNGNIEKMDSLIPYVNKDIQNSFSEKTVVLKFMRNIDVLQSYTGNIILYSDKELVIKKTDKKIENALIFAPKIKIEEGVSMNAQLFASDSLIVEKNVHLIYPSSLGVFNKNEGSLKVDSNATIEGNVVLLSGNKKSHVTINKGVKIDGLVYSNQLLSFRGILKGTIVSNELYYKSSASTYSNMLFDAEITSAPYLNFGSTQIVGKTTPQIIKYVN